MERKNIKTSNHINPQSLSMIKKTKGKADNQPKVKEKKNPVFPMTKTTMKKPMMKKKENCKVITIKHKYTSTFIVSILVLIVIFYF